MAKNKRQLKLVIVNPENEERAKKRFTECVYRLYISNNKVCNETEEQEMNEAE